MCGATEEARESYPREGGPTHPPPRKIQVDNPCNGDTPRQRLRLERTRKPQRPSEDATTAPGARVRATR